MARTARELMRTEVETVSPETTLADLERAFLRERVSGFPVVSGRRLVGIVSRSDVVRQLALERNLAESVSDYYRDLRGFEPDDAEVLEAIGEQVGERLARLRVKDVMSTALIQVAPEDGVQQVARTLLEHRIHRVPVVERGELVGILTSLDLVREVAEGRAGG